MSRMRLKYTREESVKYISHLDFMRTFQRAIKRAEVPIDYSQGFNPHPMMSFGLPLSVGVTSEGEYIEIELKEEIDPQDLVLKLNNALPLGIRILNARILDAQEPKVSKIISMADYKVTVYLKSEFSGDLSLEIRGFLNSDNISIEKKGKKSTKIVNIRNDIHGLSIAEQNKDSIVFFIRVNAGSVSNLKPEFVLNALEEKIEGLKIDYMSIHRVRMMSQDGIEIE